MTLNLHINLGSFIEMIPQPFNHLVVIIVERKKKHEKLTTDKDSAILLLTLKAAFLPCFNSILIETCFSRVLVCISSREELVAFVLASRSTERRTIKCESKSSDIICAFKRTRTFVTRSQRNCIISKIAIKLVVNSMTPLVVSLSIMLRFQRS